MQSAWNPPADNILPRFFVRTTVWIRTHESTLTLQYAFTILPKAHFEAVQAKHNYLIAESDLFSVVVAPAAIATMM